MIQPGPLSPLAAKELTAALADLSRLQTEVKRIVLPGEKEFPAKWTAATFNATINNYVCTWIEEYWNSNGQRVNKPGGRFGNTTISPAFPAGNGLIPPAAFPVQVMMREASLAIDPDTSDPWGMTYYFDWNCTCGGSGSGSGSGGGGDVTTACCSNAIPATLHATITTTSGLCTLLNGQVFTLTYLGNLAGTDIWEGSKSLGGFTWSVALECDSGGSWTVLLISDNPLCTESRTAGDTPTCGPPFSMVSEGHELPITCAFCDSAIVTITITP